MQIVGFVEDEEDFNKTAVEAQYRLNIDYGEQIVVSASLLYAFVRERKHSDSEERLCHSSSSDDDDEIFPGEEPLPDFDAILREVQRTLTNAWKLPNDQRSKVVKRLKLQWHPDKHSENNKEQSTKVFQYISNVEELLNKGLPVDETDSDILRRADRNSFSSASCASYNGSSYSNRSSQDEYLHQRANEHRRQQQEYKKNYMVNTSIARKSHGENFYWSFHQRNPQRGEGKKVATTSRV